jgi:hypothetical protein
MMNINIKELLAKEINRQDFLKIIGLLLLSLIGLPRILDLLNNTDEINKITNGHGHSGSTLSDQKHHDSGSDNSSSGDDRPKSPNPGSSTDEVKTNLITNDPAMYGLGIYGAKLYGV